MGESHRHHIEPKKLDIRVQTTQFHYVKFMKSDSSLVT